MGAILSLAKLITFTFTSKLYSMTLLSLLYKVEDHPDKNENFYSKNFKDLKDLREERKTAQSMKYNEEIKLVKNGENVNISCDNGRMKRINKEK